MSVPADLMTPGEVAALFRVSAKTVTRWAASGRVESIKTPGGHRRFARAAVEQLLFESTDGVSFVDGGHDAVAYLRGGVS